MIFVHSGKIHVAKIFTQQNANNSCARKIHALQFRVTDVAIESITEDRKGDVVVFTNGSVKRGSKSRDRLTLVRVMEKSGATEMTTSSMYMDFVAITEAFGWLKDTDYKSATNVTDSMSTLEEVICTMMYAERKAFICKVISSEASGSFTLVMLE